MSFCLRELGFHVKFYSYLIFGSSVDLLNQHYYVISQLKVVDSRPARSAGRVKKSCFKTLENVCVCYEGSIII